MEEYSSSYRLYPLWAVLLLTIPVGLGVWALAAARYSDTLAGTPLFALCAYGLAVAYINRAWVRVTGEGVGTGFGPLPCGVQPVWVPREEIEKIYVRLVEASETTPRWAAGVERTDGHCVDLTDPLAPGETVREAAQEIALVLQWQEPIEIVRGKPGARLAVPLLLWGALLIAATLWAALQIL
ncbi:MAG: hypothetical protein ABIO24_11250 [Saprospiraceae bacterium]